MIVKGRDLTPDQRRRVLAAFVHRHLDTTSRTDDEWLAKHSFRFTRDGRLMGRRSALPEWWEEERKRRPNRASSRVRGRSPAERPITFLLVGLAAFWLLRGSGGASTQAPVNWWFNPTTLALTYAPSLTPPGAGFRPASSYEVSTYYNGGSTL